MSWGFPNLDTAAAAVPVLIRAVALLAAAVTHAGGDHPDTVKQTADEFTRWLEGK